MHWVVLFLTGVLVVLAVEFIFVAPDLLGELFELGDEEDSSE